MVMGIKHGLIGSSVVALFNLVGCTNIGTTDEKIDFKNKVWLVTFPTPGRTEDDASRAFVIHNKDIQEFKKRIRRSRDLHSYYRISLHDWEINSAIAPHRLGGGLERLTDKISKNYADTGYLEWELEDLKHNYLKAYLFERITFISRSYLFPRTNPPHLIPLYFQMVKHTKPNLPNNRGFVGSREAGTYHPLRQGVLGNCAPSIFFDGDYCLFGSDGSPFDKGKDNTLKEDILSLRRMDNESTTLCRGVGSSDCPTFTYKFVKYVRLNNSFISGLYEITAVEEPESPPDNGGDKDKDKDTPKNPSTIFYATIPAEKDSYLRIQMLYIDKKYCNDGIHKDPEGCTKWDNQFYKHYVLLPGIATEVPNDWRTWFSGIFFPTFYGNIF